MILQACSISFWILLLLEYKSAPQVNSWITRRVRNESLWALRYANVSPGLDAVRNQSALHESARYQNDCRRRSIIPVPRSRSGWTCIVSRASLWFCTFYRNTSCLHVDFKCFKLALWPTLRLTFMHFWSFLTRSGDKHDEGISNCTLTPLQAGPSSRFSRFCRESHDFLTFLTTRLPISWILKKHHSEMKHFFGWIKAEMFTVAES